MSKDPLEVTIPNWAMFGAKRAVVNVFENVINGEFLYSGAILFWLNDGTKEGDENYEEKTITIFTNVVVDDAKKCALIVAEYASSLFEEFGSDVYVFNEDSEIIDEFDLNELELSWDDISMEEYANYEPEEVKKVIH